MAIFFATRPGESVSTSAERSTDFILVDGATGSAAPAQVPDHAGGPVDRGARGHDRSADARRGSSLVDVGHVVHGTTLVTNAIIERTGARLGLLTTRGFRDVLEMGTEQRYDIHDLFLAFPAPLSRAPGPARDRGAGEP